MAAQNLRGNYRYLDRHVVLYGAQDRASPNFMGLASLGLEIGIICDFPCSVLLLNAILGLYFLGLALSRPQVLRDRVHPLRPAVAAAAAGAGVATGGAAIKCPLPSARAQLQHFDRIYL